jgi:hypothetical protein
MKPKPVRSQYFLVREHTLLANTYGLHSGDVLAIHADGDSSILRRVSMGPPLPIRVRIAQEGILQALEPVAT